MKNMILLGIEGAERKSHGSAPSLSSRRGFVPQLLFLVFFGALFAAMTSATVVAQINFVQVNSSSPNSASSVSAAYSSAQTAGNLNIVAIGWSDASSTITSMSDGKGNVYKLAVSQASATSGMTHAIYYASNIVAAVAGTNTVTVNFSGNVSFPDLRILEYSGVNALDKTASAAGSGSPADSGGAITTVASELLFGANYTFGATSAAGTGYTSRLITLDGDIVEDQVVSTTGTYHATASMSNKAWIMQLATFSRGGSGGAPPPAPTGLTATAVSSSQINLSWTASTGATSYNLLRSTTTGGPYTQILSGLTTTSFSDTGLAASTTYFYVVQAVNSAGTSGNSNQASATTQAGPPPAPTNLTATAGNAQVSLSWTASSGATSYNVLRSTTPGGPYTQISSGVTTTSYTDTTVTNGTTYFYVVQAVSGGGTSGNSNQASATPTAPPPAPTGLTATAVSSSQINLSWTAATGATSYNLLRSTTTGGPYTQILSGLTTTSFSDTGLAASTTYFYVVQAVNSAGTSGNSNQASATTQAAASGVTVTISPASVTVATDEVLVLTATVSGTTNTAVTWQVNGVQGGNSTTGVISTTVPGTTGEALYLAPATVSTGFVTVTAVSQASPASSASAAVTIQTPSRSGVTYYVSTAGSDSNPGTLSAPFRTIQHAANTAVAGDTVQVRGGVYNEKVTPPNSGNATAGYITFMSYPGETATVDGTGISCCGSTGQDGLFYLTTNNYIIIQGFEIRNYTTTSSATAVGIDFEGAGNYLEILNNHIHNIVATGGSCSSSNALGVAIYGRQAPASINHLTFSGNEVDHNTTGCSETVTVNGNVQYWVEANNLIHDDNNIGMDFIGFEGTSPDVNYDQARDGWNFKNTIYNISSSSNPVYKANCWCADGFYADGGTRIIIERDLVHDVDINEAASEHSGHVSSYVTIRNNVIYNMNAPGISIGGYSSRVGGSDHITIVNNTLYNDSTKVSGQGEFQIQYHATNNTFENNAVYGTQSLLVNDYTTSSANPATLDYNDWFATVGAGSATFVWQRTSITGFSNYQVASGQDTHSPFADPQFVNRSSTPPNLDITASSQAVNLGTNLGSDVVGVLDFNGNPRVNASGQINAGAYEQ